MLRCNEWAQARSRCCVRRPQPTLAGMAGERCCSQEPAVLLRCVLTQSWKKKKLTVKLSPADFPVSCSGNSLLYSGQILSFSQKNEIKLIGILTEAKWILAQTLLTKIFQALAVLHLDLWSISGNASIVNELVLISPPRLMFWAGTQVIQMPISSFFKGTEHPNSLPQKRAPPPSTEHPNLHPKEARADLTAICFVTVAETSWGTFLATHTARQHTGCGSKGEKNSFHVEKILYTHVYHYMRDSALQFALCQLIWAKPEWEFKTKPYLKRLNQHYVVSRGFSSCFSFPTQSASDDDLAAAHCTPPPCPGDRQNELQNMFFPADLRCCQVSQVLCRTWLLLAVLTWRQSTRFLAQLAPTLTLLSLQHRHFLSSAHHCSHPYLPLVLSPLSGAQVPHLSVLTSTGISNKGHGVHSILVTMFATEKLCMCRELHASWAAFLWAQGRQQSQSSALSLLLAATSQGSVCHHCMAVWKAEVKRSLSSTVRFPPWPHICLFCLSLLPDLAWSWFLGT